MVNVAIIGGTGFNVLPDEFETEPFEVETPAGAASLMRATRSGREFLFLSRHGVHHGVAPHEINYRANIAALAQLGIRYVMATNAVGSLRLDLPPGSLVVLDDFIDFTRNRELTYWSGMPNQPAPVVHTDFTKPYSEAVRNAILTSASGQSVHVTPRGCYLCADGPRFETPSEIRLFRAWGADVVGMTGLPEAIFAKEAGLHYAAIAIVSNFGAGLTDEPVDHETNSKETRLLAGTAREIMLGAAELL